MGIFFVSFFNSSLSNRGAKSKNEFAATENHCTKGVRHVTNKFRKIRIFAGAVKSKFLFRQIVFQHFRIFFRPCRGPLAARLRRMT